MTESELKALLKDRTTDELLNLLLVGMEASMADGESIFQDVFQDKNDIENIA